MANYQMNREDKGSHRSGRGAGMGDKRGPFLQNFPNKLGNKDAIIKPPKRGVRPKIFSQPHLRDPHPGFLTHVHLWLRTHCDKSSFCNFFSNTLINQWQSFSA